MKSSKKRRTKKETQQTENLDHQTTKQTRSCKRSSLQEGSLSEKGSQQEEECPKASQENGLSSSSVDEGLRSCYTPSQVNEEQDEMCTVSKTICLKTEDEECSADNINSDNSVLCKTQTQNLDVEKEHVSIQEASAKPDSQIAEDECATNMQKAVKRKYLPHSFDNDSQIKLPKLVDESCSSAVTQDETKDITQSNISDLSENNSRMTEEKEKQSIINADVQITKGLKINIESKTSNCNKPLNDKNFDIEAKQNVSNETRDKIAPIDSEGKSSQDIINIKSNLSQGFNVSIYVNEEDTKDTFPVKVNLNKEEQVNLSNHLLNNNEQSTFMETSSCIGTLTCLDKNKSPTTISCEQPAESEVKSSDIKDEQTNPNVLNDSKTDMPLVDKIKSNAYNTTNLESNTLTAEVSNTVSEATKPKSTMSDSVESNSSPPSKPIETTEEKTVAQNKDGIFEVTGTSEDQSESVIENKEAKFEVAGTTEDKSNSIVKNQGIIFEVTANNEITNQSADLTDSQLCDALDEGDFEMEIDDAQNKAREDIVKKRQEGESLVGTILRELGSVNKQMLRIKREIETAKRKMKPIKPTMNK